MSAAWNAVRALRGDTRARELEAAVRGLSHWLDATFGRDPLHLDARQETLLKVWRYAKGCEATSTREAEAWVRRIYKNAHLDLLRRKRRVCDPTAVENGPSPGLVLDDDVERVEVARDELFDRLDAHLEERFGKPVERANARRRAEVAWLRHIDGVGADEARALLVAQGEPVPSDAALYKWVERGRDKVLLPFLDALLEQSETLSGTLEAIARELHERLTSTRRADAGKARPSRRKGEGEPESRSGVSPRNYPTSVQYDAAQTHPASEAPLPAGPRPRRRREGGSEEAAREQGARAHEGKPDE